jgi:hypothetical protein
MFLLALFSLLITLTSGSPALAARQSVTITPSPTPTACPYPTVPTGGSWMAAATNIAAIPTGLLTPCQLGCLGMSLAVILFMLKNKADIELSS